MPTVKMNKNELIKVFGPMLINIREGVVDILNKKFSRGDKIIVHRVRSYVLRALEDSELEINMSDEAQIQAVEEEEPYLEWLSSVEDMLNNDPSKIMVLGGVDRGKSSFSVLVINTCLDKGLKPALIDGDVGQADVGPPGFIALSYPEQPVIWMRELKPVSMRFIGDIKPQHHIGSIILKTRELIDKAISDGRSPVVIDTDGWIGDEYAISYKQKLINEVKPDTLVVIGSEIHGFFKKYERLGVKVYELRAPSMRRTRSREERRALRREKYLEYLGEPRIVKIPLNQVVITGHPLFNGVEEALKAELGVEIADKVLYISRTHDTLYVVASAPFKNEALNMFRQAYGVGKVRVYMEGFERNIYVALSNGFEDYPGLIDKIDFRNKQVVVKTKYSVEDVKLVRLSIIRLNEEFSEQTI